jgi:hypothetical protein
MVNQTVLRKLRFLINSMYYDLAVKGLHDPKRAPIILSSDSRQADAANLIPDNSSDVTKKEEKRRWIMIVSIRLQLL